LCSVTASGNSDFAFIWCTGGVRPYRAHPNESRIVT
jgi:hypothetical protein